MKGFLMNSHAYHYKVIAAVVAFYKMNILGCSATGALS